MNRTGGHEELTPSAVMHLHRDDTTHCACTPLAHDRQANAFTGTRLAIIVLLLNVSGIRFYGWVSQWCGPEGGRIRCPDSMH